MNGSQQSMTTGRPVEQNPQSRQSQQDHPDDVRYLSQRLQEFLEENTKRVDELDRKFQHLKHEKDELDKNFQHLKHENVMLSRQHNEMKETVIDIKCKVLDEFSVDDAMRDRSPRPDVGTEPQMAAHIDLRRPTTLRFSPRARQYRPDDTLQRLSTRTKTLPGGTPHTPASPRRSSRTTPRMFSSSATCTNPINDRARYCTGRNSDMPQGVVEARFVG
ncbi:hypothetical protein GE09DRAFT_1294985, partial [Coniochaeta sp. 2T2.1]